MSKCSGWGWILCLRLPDDINWPCAEVTAPSRLRQGTWSRGDGEQSGCPRTGFPENHLLPFPLEPSSCGHGVYLETSPKRLPLMMKGTSTWGLREAKVGV